MTDASLISGFAALAGAAIGGLTSATAAWFTQRTMAHSQWSAGENLRRQDIYREFIEIASKCYIDALQHFRSGRDLCQDLADAGLVIRRDRRRGRTGCAENPRYLHRSPTRPSSNCEAWPKTMPSTFCMASARPAGWSTSSIARGNSNAIIAASVLIMTSRLRRHFFSSGWRWTGSTHSTVSGFSTGSMSRLIATASPSLRTSTHSSTSSGLALIS